MCMISPQMVSAMGGSGLITAASLQIKDAGNHILPTEGAIFIVITRKDKFTGLEKRTHQMAYVSPRDEDLVLSREAMECLGLVSGLDDSKAASVRYISSTPVTGGAGTPVPSSGGSGSGGGSSRDGGPRLPGSGGRQYMQSEGVPGGQLTLDLVASHNQDNPKSQVSPGDLKPSTDPDFQCRGTVKNVAGFDAMSNEVLRKFIISRYMKSGFNNCRIQPLKMMYTDRPLELFVDPNVKPVDIHKAAVIPMHLKA